MSKPSEEELETALKMAIQMKEKDIDPFFVAKALLNHNYRIKHLEKVLKAADRYINMGMADRERTQLIKIIDKAKETEAHASRQESDRFGLE